MTLGFSNIHDFKNKVLSGSKVHSIRVDANKRWRPGVVVNMVTGNRTKLRSEFKTSVCVSTQQIEIMNGVVKVDGKTLRRDEVDKLAQKDGFDSVNDFLLFFKDDFKGTLIHWTNMRY